MVANRVYLATRSGYKQIALDIFTEDYWGLFHWSLPGREGGMSFFFIFLLVVGVKPIFCLCWVVFFSIGGGGGTEISGVPPSQVYLNGTALQKIMKRKFKWWCSTIQTIIIVSDKNILKDFFSKHTYHMLLQHLTEGLGLRSSLLIPVQLKI